MSAVDWAWSLLGLNPIWAPLGHLVPSYSATCICTRGCLGPYWYSDQGLEGDPPGHIHRIIRSMPRHNRKCIQAYGGHNRHYRGLTTFFAANSSFLLLPFISITTLFFSIIYSFGPQRVNFCNFWPVWGSVVQGKLAVKYQYTYVIFVHSRLSYALK